MLHWLSGSQKFDLWIFFFLYEIGIPCVEPTTLPFLSFSFVGLLCVLLMYFSPQYIILVMSEIPVGNIQMRNEVVMYYFADCGYMNV